MAKPKIKSKPEQKIAKNTASLKSIKNLKSAIHVVIKADKKLVLE